MLGYNREESEERRDEYPTVARSVTDAKQGQHDKQRQDAKNDQHDKPRSVPASIKDAEEGQVRGRPSKDLNAAWDEPNPMAQEPDQREVKEPPIEIAEPIYSDPLGALPIANPFVSKPAKIKPVTSVEEIQMTELKRPSVPPPLPPVIDYQSSEQRIVKAVVEALSSSKALSLPQAARSELKLEREVQAQAYHAPSAKPKKKGYETRSSEQGRALNSSSERPRKSRKTRSTDEMGPYYVNQEFVKAHGQHSASKASRQTIGPSKSGVRVQVPSKSHRYTESLGARPKVKKQQYYSSSTGDDAQTLPLPSSLSSESDGFYN